MSEGSLISHVIDEPETLERGERSGGIAVAVLVTGGVLFHLGALLAVYLLQAGDYHLLIWGVSEVVLIAGLAVSALLAVIHAITSHRAFYLAGLGLLALLAAGVQDVQGTDWLLAILLVTFLLAVEMPSGAHRLKDLRAATPLGAGKEARGDLARYTLYYLISAPLTLLAIAALTILALSLPDLLLGGLSEKYTEALETRSVFFVVGMTWLIVAPLLGIRALWQLRRRFQPTETPRPTSPISTGSTVLDPNKASNEAPLIEVTA